MLLLSHLPPDVYQRLTKGPAFPIRVSAGQHFHLRFLSTGLAALWLHGDEGWTQWWRRFDAVVHFPQTSFVDVHLLTELMASLPKPALVPRWRKQWEKDWWSI